MNRIVLVDKWVEHMISRQRFRLRAERDDTDLQVENALQVKLQARRVVALSSAQLSVEITDYDVPQLGRKTKR